MQKVWKGTLSVLLCILLSVSCLTVGALGDTAAGWKWGDINADQDVDSFDALLALQHSVGLITLNEEEFRIADVDGSKKVDSTDALYILQYSVGLIDRFPVESLEPDNPDPGTETGFNPNPGPKMEVDLEHMIRVTDAPYNAKGDGTTNDRAAIQAAIDAAHAAGGGTVGLTAGKTFLSGNLLLRSNVILYFEDGAILKQSGNAKDFVDPLNNYEPYELKFSADVDASILWNVSAFYNYPLIYAGEGTKNITITGNGVIEMNAGNDPRGTMMMQAIGLFQVDGFELSDITIRKYYAYCTKAISCTNGLYKNLTIDITGGLLGGTDGINLGNCQNIRVTECNLNTGDDGVYVCSAWRDPREGLWYDNENPLPSKNIEIDHNHCEVAWDETKAFCFIMWGSQFPDQKQVEVSNIYIHDNYFETIGAWTGNWNTETKTFDFNGSCNPMKNIRFENNEVGTIQSSWYSLPVSDFYGFDSMSVMKNGDFESIGELYWLTRAGGSAGVKKDLVGQEGTYYGYIDSLDQADAALYQGIKFTEGYPYKLTARVQSSGDTVRLFVKDQVTQELIAFKEFNNTEWQKIEFSFEVPKTGNYHIGVERGNAAKGWGRIDSLSFQIDIEAPEEGENILGDQRPDEIKSGNENMLGVAFSSKIDGQITHARMYTSANESGTHLVGVWDAETEELLTGKLYEWEVLSGYEGWQYYKLPTPISIEAGRQYVIGVSSGSGTFAWSGNFYTTTAVNGNLITYATGGRWRDMYVNGAGFPDLTTASNYFRDVVFVPGETTDPDSPERTSLSIDEAIVTTYGRTYSANDALYFNWTMSGFSFEVNGTDAYATFDITKNNNRDVYVNVYLDGGTDPCNTLCLSKSGEYLLAGDLPEGVHTIKVLKRSEASIGTVAVSTVSSSGSFTGNAPSKSTRTIEVLGDSITAGFGNLVTDGGSGTHTSYEQDGTRTYATMAAEHFGADITAVCASGIGCLYIGNGPDCVMQDIYPYVDGLNLDTTTQYNFQDNPSDVVIISLGTNDAGCGSDSELIAAAEKMITMVRQKNPNAVIIWCYGMMVTHRSSLFKQAVDNIKATGDDKVYYLALPTANAATEGSGVGGHPTLASHLTASKVLTNFIATVTGWDTVDGSMDSIPEGETILTTQIPDETKTGAGQIMMGVAFSPKVDGTITHIRFYACAEESGTHLAGLWDDETGELLTSEIYEWEIIAGSTGWLYYELSTPVAVKAGKTYIVGVTNGPDAHFSWSGNHFVSTMENGNLITYETGGRWLDLVTYPLGVPSSTTASNYFRDVVFVSDESYDPKPTPDKTENVFTTQIPTETVNLGGVPNSLGMVFSTKADGTITKVRLYTSALEGGIHRVALWDYATGAMLTEEMYEWNITAGTEGWQEFTLPTSVNVKAGTQYVVSVTCGPDAIYMKGANQLASSIENGNLVTYEKSGLYSTNANNATTHMPDGATASNYFRDVVFVPAD